MLLYKPKNHISSSLGSAREKHLHKTTKLTMNFMFYPRKEKEMCFQSYMLPENKYNVKYFNEYHKQLPWGSFEIAQII